MNKEPVKGMIVDFGPELPRYDDKLEEDMMRRSVEFATHLFRIVKQIEYPLLYDDGWTPLYSDVRCLNISMINQIKEMYDYFMQSRSVRTTDIQRLINDLEYNIGKIKRKNKDE